MIAAPRQRRLPPQQQRTQSAQIPAAIAGINATASLAGMSPFDCVYTFNLLAEDEGMTVRPGYSEWANGWTGQFGKTVIPFEGNVASENKLFIANEEGIWDVTTSGTTSPTQVVTFPSSGGDAGVCSYVNFTNDGSERYLLVCDAQNGYYYWKQSTNTWTKAVAGAAAGQIDGADPADFDYVMVWKERVWFIESGSGNAWYLPVQQFAGTVASFNFGVQFARGGFLKALHNWTIDGGEGVDDYLIALSSAGDVVIYQGTDPASASTFSQVGVWQIGRLPAGNRVATEFGGELYILSIRGLVRASQLLQGNLAEPEAYVSSRVAPYMRTVINETFDDFGWHIHPHPKSSRLYVNAPPRIDGEQWGFSYYFGTATNSWSIVRGLPKGHSANWQGDVYWLDLDQNKLYRETGHVDKVYLDSATDGDPQAIESDLLTSFSALEAPGRMKRIQFIRPIFISELSPVYAVKPRYNYNISEITVNPTTFAAEGVGVWDSSAWDLSTWAGSPAASTSVRGGAGGVGTTVAVALRLSTTVATTLVAFDIMSDFGGLV